MLRGIHFIAVQSEVVMDLLSILLKNVVFSQKIVLNSFFFCNFAARLCRRYNFCKFSALK